MRILVLDTETTDKIQNNTKYVTMNNVELFPHIVQFSYIILQDDEIEKISVLDDFHTFAFTLEDKFGDNGLICVIILQEKDIENIFIDTWFMSCRVLKRGMENFVLNTITEFCKDKGYKHLVGEYISSAKNEMVKDHYENLGFEMQNNFWVLDIKNYKNRITHITKK